MTNETETQQQMPSVSDMVRTTAENQSDFLVQVAAHIDELEGVILTMQRRIAELESPHDTSE